MSETACLYIVADNKDPRKETAIVLKQIVQTFSSCKPDFSEPLKQGEHCSHTPP